MLSLRFFSTSAVLLHTFPPFQTALVQPRALHLRSARLTKMVFNFISMSKLYFLLVSFLLLMASRHSAAMSPCFLKTASRIVALLRFTL
ncbi:hypothetical protein L1987_53717 [Smallanthus sonchifolius]|uniref:Uncharacterized protein n=1 Tax=Smallanthus sonchifolius TaxID=185202 RepID=A0ACB9EXF1_9ASTR|nr:hypothetical protein L1987_53717 [Smallanthus sonchifolius]